jgi:hypothetical protein
LRRVRRFREAASRIEEHKNRSQRSSSVAKAAADRLLAIRHHDDGKLSAQARTVFSYVGRNWTDLHFSIVNLRPAPNRYVAWIDLMGAGHLMSTSMGKSANTIARLHVAVNSAATRTAFTGTRLAINDGIFIVSDSKCEVMSLLRWSIALLGATFLTITPHNRVMVRAAIAYGPVYHGSDLAPHLGQAKGPLHEGALQNVMFGPPVIQAVQHEHIAAPFGVAIHESARAFAPPNTRPFKSSHWGWWTADEYWRRQDPFAALANLLGHEIACQYEFIKKNLLFYETPHFNPAKIAAYQKRATDYFLGAKKERDRLAP